MKVDPSLLFEDHVRMEFVVRAAMNIDGVNTLACIKISTDIQGS